MNMIANEALIAKIDLNDNTILRISCSNDERRLLIFFKVLTLVSLDVRENVQLLI